MLSIILWNKSKMPYPLFADILKEGTFSFLASYYICFYEQLFGFLAKSLLLPMSTETEWGSLCSL